MQLKRTFTLSLSTLSVLMLGLAQVHADDGVTRPSTGPYSQAEHTSKKTKVRLTPPSSKSYRGSLENFKPQTKTLKFNKVKQDEYQLRLKITQTLQEYRGVELICPSGFQDHQEVIQGFVTWSNVPDEVCDLQFKGGGPPDLYHGATNGQSLFCKSDAQIVSCESVTHAELMADAPQASESSLILAFVAPFSHHKLVVTCNAQVLFQEFINQNKGREEFSYELPKDSKCKITLKGGGKPYTIQPVHAGMRITCSRGSAKSGKPKSKISPDCEFENY